MTAARLVARAVDGRRCTGAALSVYDSRDGSEAHHAAGDLDPVRPYFAASVTKMLTAALVLQQIDAGRIDLDTPFRHWLAGPETAELNRHGGVDRTDGITVRHLLAHTSGLPDHFQPGSRAGRCARLMRGEDSRCGFEQALEIARRLGAIGAPGTARAHYSDTSYQLLGRLLETLSGLPLAEQMRVRLFSPLGLTRTWLYDDPFDRRPKPLRHRGAELAIPLAMADAGADGGLVTSAREGLALLRAFFEGRWFDRRRLPELQDWRPMFFPLRYGMGLMRYADDRLPVDAGAAGPFGPVRGLPLSRPAAGRSLRRHGQPDRSARRRVPAAGARGPARRASRAMSVRSGPGARSPGPFSPCAVRVRPRTPEIPAGRTGSRGRRGTRSPGRRR